MTILKNGTPTGFQDKNGKDIKTADRIKHVLDGSILTIDKFARAVSPLGFKYDLLSMHVQRGMNADGTYFSRLTDYELTDELPPKHEGEVVRLGNDADNMAPDRVRDPRNERLHGPKPCRTAAHRRRHAASSPSRTTRTRTSATNCATEAITEK